MATKIRHIYPTAELPSMLATAGRQPSDGVPLRWLEALVTNIRQHILATGGTEQEADSVTMYGTEHLRATMVDDLTEVEVMRDRLAALEAQAQKWRELFRPDGTVIENAREVLAQMGKP